jgi:hypothetical protein
MAHRALKAHTFPGDLWRIGRLRRTLPGGLWHLSGDKRPKTSPVQQQLQASVAARLAIAGQIGVDRSIGESKNGN